jgi:hypothetical protein
VGDAADYQLEAEMMFPDLDPADAYAAYSEHLVGRMGGNKQTRRRRKKRKRTPINDRRPDRRGPQK